MALHFLQSVNTPKGPGIFIGYFRDGIECQVSRWVQRDGKKICVNEVYPAGVVTEAKTTVRTKPERVPVSQVQG